MPSAGEVTGTTVLGAFAWLPWLIQGLVLGVVVGQSGVWRHAFYGGQKMWNRLAWLASTVRNHEQPMDMADYYVQHIRDSSVCTRRSTRLGTDLATLNSPFDLQ